MQPRKTPPPTFLLALSLVGLFSAIATLTGCGSGVAPVPQANAGTQGPSGAPGLIFLGPYDVKGSYVSTDAVSWQGSSYIAVASSTGVNPTGSPASSTAWALLAQAGTNGAAGAKGVDGLQGPAGFAGPQGPTGSSGPSGPQGPAGAAGQNLISFLHEKHFSVLGDSISSQYDNAWQQVVAQRTGMTQVTQDARPGRTFASALECWGNPSPGAVPGSFQVNQVIPALGMPCSSISSGFAEGATLAQSMANTDVLFIQMGTNDQGTTLGAPGDASSAGTIYGNMRWVVETYLAAKPSLRIILISVQYNGFATPARAQAVAAATELYGQSMGIPVVNMFKVGGVNAASAVMLTRDGTHPSDYGFAHFYGPVIAQAVQANF